MCKKNLLAASNSPFLNIKLILSVECGHILSFVVKI